MEEKRLFIGGLTPSVKEEDLRKILSNFGDIKDVKLKSKFDAIQNETKIFAFIEMQITPDNLALCFRSYANKKWKGCTLNLQVARESILDRLKREREAAQEQKRTSYQMSSKLNNEPKTNTLISSHKPPTFSVLKKIKKEQKKAISSESDSSDEEPTNPLEIPLFHGLKYHKVSDLTDKNVSSISKNDNADSDSSNSSADTDEIIRQNSKNVKVGQPKNEPNFNLKGRSVSSVQQKLLSLGGISIPNSSVVSSNQQNFSQEKTLLASGGTSKVTKHELSNKKRLESMKIRESQEKSKKLAIKSALSQIDVNEVRNNKITFHYDDSDDNGKRLSNINGKSDKPDEESSVNASKKVADALFDSDSDENQDAADDFRIRPQYEGEKGQKLISLQHTFGNDDRFKMDEKFIESDSSDEDESSADVNMASKLNEEENFVEEKQRNFDILQSVLGKELNDPIPEKVAKSLFRDTREFRYDPTDPNSARLEVQSKETVKKTKKKKILEAQEEASLPEVSSEKYYEVSNNLMERFIKDPDVSESKDTGFSLLSMFDNNSESKKDVNDNYSFEVIKNGNEDAPTNQKEKNTPKAGRSPKMSSVLKKYFFFQKDDERLTRGVDFFVRTEDLNDLRNKWSAERREFLDVFNAQKKQAKRKSKGKPQRQNAKRGRFRK